MIPEMLVIDFHSYPEHRTMVLMSDEIFGLDFS